MAAEITALVSQLRSGDATQRTASAEQLSKMGTDAQPAAVALVEACGSDDLREFAVAALEDLGPPTAGDLQQLSGLLKRPSLDVAYWAATLLGRLGENAAAATPALADALQNHGSPAVRQRAAWALGQIGPPAHAAQPALAAAAAGSDARLAALAREALESLRA